MRIQLLRSTPGSPPRRRREDASAVIVVVILVAILLIYVGANIRTLHHLGQELRLIERQQIRRLQTLSVKPINPNQKSEADVAPSTAIPALRKRPGEGRLNQGA